MNLNELYAKISKDFWKVEQVTGWAKRTFFERSIYRDTSSGTVHKQLPVKLNDSGELDTTLFGSTSGVVETTGAQTVGGVKTFTDRPQVKLAGAYAGIEFFRDQAAIGSGAAMMRLEALSNDSGFGGTKTLARIEALPAETFTNLTAQTDIVFYATPTSSVTMVEVGRFSNGNLVLAGGLLFDNEAITVYDEATYTPAITGDTNPTVAYTSRYGAYHLTNKGCQVQAQMIINTISGGSGSARISLPATSHSSGGQVLSAMWWDASGTQQTCTLHIAASTAYGLLVLPSGGYLAATDLAASDQINIGGFYLTA